MAGFQLPFHLTRYKATTFRTVVAVFVVAGVASTSASLLSGCAASEALAQSAPQTQNTVATLPSSPTASLQDISATQALLHVANTSFRAHDWLGALTDYQQIYYSDPEHGGPDDRGPGSFAQARMSLCHTWMGVNALNSGDYAASKNELTAALDDDSANAVAKRLLIRSNRQYHLLTTVEDVRQPMRDIDDAPDQQAALGSIRASSARSSALLARLTNGTAKQKRAAFRFLEAYDDAFVANFLLSHAVTSQEEVSQDIALSPDQSAPSDNEVIYDIELMVQTFPQINDIGQAAFASDDIAEVVQYQPVLDAERNQLAEDNQEIQGDFYENFFEETLGSMEGRDAKLQARQSYLGRKNSEAAYERSIGIDPDQLKP